MDFFQQQDRARKRTGRLLLLFILGVFGLVLLTYLLIVLILRIAEWKYGERVISASLWHPYIFGVVTIAMLLVISCGSLYKVAELAGGGASVALLMGGKLIPRATQDFHQKRLLNVVEEMAIASGVPVPPVYLLDEDGINAFAAGYSPSDAIVAVSRGCLQYLNRDELQGVVAHEFSHVLNGDMRLNIRLIALIHGITIISLIGIYVIYATGRGGSGKKDGALYLLLLGVVLYLIGIGGAFFGQLIRAAVSRQREFLADASAVQFTRYPDGIGGALKKIGGLEQGSAIKHAGASEVSHMFFADGVEQRFTQMFDTHPPLPERIRAIDPHWDGKFPRVKELDPDAERVAEARRQPRPLNIGLPSLPGMRQLPIPVLALADTSAQPVDEVQPVEAPAIPVKVREAISEPFSARAVIYALLLDPDDAIRIKQWANLEAASDSRDLAETKRLEPLVRAVAEGSRLTLAHLAKPALRQMSLPQYKEFRQHVDQLILADEQISLFEFCLRTAVLQQLDIAFGRRGAPRIRYRSLDQLANEAKTVLGMLAWEGSADESAVRKAFGDGWAELFAGQPVAELPPKSQATLSAFAMALNAFRHATPRIKRALVSACGACIRSDGFITPREADLLRAISSALDSPLAAGPASGTAA